MLTTSFDMLKKAYEGHYAVPAINTQGGTYDIIRAICMAAEELKSPIILAHYVSTGEYSGHDWFFETAKWMADKVSVPVAVHLDHGDSFERCMEMLKIGFTSIMYDGSAYPVEENARRTEEVAKVCRAFGVPLEAEIGELARLDDQGRAMGCSNIADPEVVKLAADFTAPFARLEETLAMYEEGIAASGMTGVIFGHISQNHLHVNLLPKSREEWLRGRALLEEWAGRIAAWGGLVVSENGVGKLKRELLRAYAPPEALAAAGTLKRLLDPRGLLNPGNML